MSLYREARGRSLWQFALVAAIALAVGIGIGILLAPEQEEPRVAESLVALDAELNRARSALDLVTIEYPQAVADGEVAQETELSAALSQAKTAQSTVAAAEADLLVLDAERTEELGDTIDQLVAAIEEHAESAAVDRLAKRAERTLDSLTGGP
jgi:hypothetical protein